jgi:hypothetical protein
MDQLQVFEADFDRCLLSLRQFLALVRVGTNEVEMAFAVIGHRLQIELVAFGRLLLRLSILQP